jgi:uncharacterized Ntn-hydrolase superfamily protein
MTFTILGRDTNTGELGIGIATYSLAVGATCPRILPGLGVVTSQASTNPAIGEEIMELLEDGIDPTDAFMQALANDDHPEYRQIALLTPTGDPLIHSGANIKPSSGHVSGANCIAIGNFLASDNVLDAMVKGFENPDTIQSMTPSTTNDSSLANRLLSALAAGKTAGGQSGSNDAHLPERSACLVVGSPQERFPIDVRVDFSNEAITDLQAAFAAYHPMHDYYLKRADDPTELPSQDEWVKQLDSK